MTPGSAKADGGRRDVVDIEHGGGPADSTDGERREIARRLREKHRERMSPGTFEGQCAESKALGYLRDLESCVPDGDSLFTVLADLIEPRAVAADASAMRAEADRLLWERHDCDGVARGLRREADRVEAAGAAVDRDALLKLAGGMEAYAGYLTGFRELDPASMSESVADMAKRIREACGGEGGGR